MGTSTTSDPEKAYTAIIDPRFCAQTCADLALWISNFSCLIPNSHYITATSDSEEASHGIRFTLDYDRSCSVFRCPDLVMRDAVAGIELVRVRAKTCSNRNRYNVYQGESLLMSIREANYAQWNVKLHIFVAPVGSINIKDHRELNEDDRVPDYTLKPAPGVRNTICPHVLQVFDDRNQKIAEVRKHPDNLIPGWVCGCGPNYRVSTCPRVDQAFITLLLSVYNIISGNKHRN